MTAQSDTTAPPQPAAARLAPWALMLGNFAVGLAVLAPAGMLNELAADLAVSIQQAGWLVTLGAVVLCFGSPLVAWATSTLDRRLLLAATLALVAAGNAASALAPNYAALMLLRLLTLAVAAVFTPQAASAISLMVPEKDRSSAISFVFLGWSLAVAIGLPLVQFIADHLGWRSAFGALAAALAAICVLAAISIPARLHGPALSLSSWGAIARNRMIVLLLCITAVYVSGMFLIFPYLGPLLSGLVGASPQTIASFFALMGVAGFIGNLVASRAVRRVGTFAAALASILVVLLGTLCWWFGASSFVTLGLGTALIGLGSLALNSMQQARLVAVAPALAGGTVALNTSSLYVGQAVGSGLGGALFAHDWIAGVGPLASTFLIGALALTLVTRRAG
ncbi:MAG TPA: MFS transporter [Xanthobacteraceae bacterium]|nr:MFS transporter [Xanthobacteraceae bacterium]